MIFSFQRIKIKEIPLGNRFAKKKLVAKNTIYIPIYWKDETRDFPVAVYPSLNIFHGEKGDTIQDITQSVQESIKENWLKYGSQEVKDSELTLDGIVFRKKLRSHFKEVRRT